MRKRFIQVVDECAGDQQIINGDGLLGHRRCTIGVTENALPGVWNSAFCATRVDELQRLAVLQGTLLDKIPSDCRVLESFKASHLKKASDKERGLISRGVSLTRPCKVGGQG